MKKPTLRLACNSGNLMDVPCVPSHLPKEDGRYAHNS